MLFNSEGGVNVYIWCLGMHNTYDVFLLIKVKRCGELCSSSSLPNLLCLMKAFVSVQEEEL